LTASCTGSGVDDRAKRFHQRLKRLSQHRPVLLPIVAVPTFPQRVSSYAIIRDTRFRVGHDILNYLARSQPHAAAIELLAEGLMLSDGSLALPVQVDVAEEFGKRVRA
jgi:hypothetical protein